MTKKKMKKVVRLTPENRKRFLEDMAITKSTWYRWAEIGSYDERADEIRKAALSKEYGGWIEKVAMFQPRKPRRTATI